MGVKKLNPSISSLTCFHLSGNCSSSFHHFPQQQAVTFLTVFLNGISLPSPGQENISIQPGVCDASFLPSLHHRAHTLNYFIQKHAPCFLLAVRAIFAYAVSKVDYLSVGTIFPSPLLCKVQILFSKVFRRLLNLFSDANLTIVSLPFSSFGWGCPRMEVRCDLAFISTKTFFTLETLEVSQVFLQYSYNF